MATPPPDDPELWVRRFHPRPDAAVRLVCLPHAGGSAGSLFGLSRDLPGFAEALCVQYPGRQDRLGEPLVDDLSLLADRVHAALRPWTDRPLALFGHSMGASLAFEVARRLERDEGVVPAVLFVSARRAPSVHRRETVHQLDDAGLLAEVMGLDGTDRSLLDHEELLRMVLPAIRADYRAVETYRCAPDASVRCPVLALTGDRDPRVTPEEAAAWERHTREEFALRVFDGGHFYLNPHHAEVVRTVGARLRERVRV
ncbi:thioesterase II family protein [Streptomyces sp. JNUCC 64]